MTLVLALSLLLGLFIGHSMASPPVARGLKFTMTPRLNTVLTA
ncbi:MAG TPA: hypothetical protein VEJ37_11805 [Xanthobacteraceae bacterium]|nr:hypothetical protein [Xanthobacteraceae bacterium]